MRTLEYVALVLVGISILGIIGWTARDFFIDPLIPLGIRVLAGIASIGFVLLLGYVTGDRIQKARREPKTIKEVKY
jgi:hypothetical protein